MNLIFDIIKNGNDIPKKRNYHFKKRSGVIGRAEDSDFYLPDSKNFISSKHALIEYKKGAYFIKDISTNGTFLKSSSKKLTKNISTKINSTDIFIIGDYEIQARFTDNDYSKDDIISYKSQLEQSNVNESLKVSKQLIPDDEDFLLENSTIMNNSFVEKEEEFIDNNIMNVFKEEEEESLDDLYDFEKEPFLEGSNNSLDSISHQSEQEHINIPRFDVSDEKKSSVQNEIMDKNDIFQRDESLEILEKKLGITISSLSKDEKESTLAEIANIVIHSLDGLKNSLDINDKIKEDLFIDNLIPTNESNHIKANNPVRMGQYSINMLNDRLDKNSLKLSEAIKKSFHEINSHNIALHRTSKNLINIAATKFSPSNLEIYFETNEKINPFLPRKYQLWNSYVKMFNKINEDQNFGTNFLAKDFSKEYNNTCFTIKLASI